MSRAAILSLTVLLAGGTGLRAQDLWDTSLRLTAGQMNGATAAGLGQDKVYGAGLSGAYPFARNHLLVLEGGYRVLPTASRLVDAQTTLDTKTDGFFGSAAYRFRFTQGLLDGLYLQGGIRHSRLLTEQDTIKAGAGAGGADLRTTLKGPRAASTKPAFAAGFRFTDTLSLEVAMAGVQAQNVQGVAKSGTLLELTLGLHL